MKKARRYSAGGGVPTTGGQYGNPAPQYPFPSVGGDTGPTSNMTVTVGGQDVSADKNDNPFKLPNAQQSQGQDQGQDQSGDTKQMRRGGKVKQSRTRGDGIAQRGKTKGRFV